MQITTAGKTTYYSYDADGIRSTKIVNGTKHEYLTLNNKVVYEKIGDGDTARIMIFSYGAQGRPFAVKYSSNNGAKFTNYFYALNQQGDVVKIFRPEAVKDADGNVTGYTEKTYATYTYDAWGKLIGITNSAGTNILGKTTSTSLANLNPLRYRGYYYDNETGFYYLQSRYYDPTVRRFVNADAYTSTGQGFVGTNMFAYCGNNPVVIADHSGNAGEEAMGWWGAGMWWLCVVDGALPIGDAVYVLGLGICCVIAGVEKSNSVISKSRIETNEISEAEMDASAATGSQGDIASRYGLYECREAALAMARRDKKRGYLIKLEFSETPGFV